MNVDCTELFLRYREIARLTWNLGFWSNPKLREWDSLEPYKEATARLFEGMILLALGYQGRIKDVGTPGEVAYFQVKAKHEVELRVDSNRSSDPSHVWGDPIVRLTSNGNSHRLRFLRFFDWDVLGARDFRFLEVVIELLNDRPELTGRHALVELSGCSVSLMDDDQKL